MHAVLDHKDFIAEELRDFNLCAEGQEVRCRDAVSGFLTRGRNSSVRVECNPDLMLSGAKAT